MDERQKAFILYIAEKLEAVNEQDLQNKVSQLSDAQLDGYKDEFEAIETQKIQFAKMGAQLNFINSLNSKCPEGYEVEKYMSGGKMKSRCKKCNGGKLTDLNRPIPKNEKGSTISEFKNRKQKMQKGGKYNEAEHARLIDGYKKKNLTDSQTSRLQELNRNSKHHDDGWAPKDSTATKKTTPKVNLKKSEKKSDGGLMGKPGATKTNESGLRAKLQGRLRKKK